MAELINGLGGTAGFGENYVERNDDYYNYVDLTELFPSGLNFFGNVYNGLYVNNNGSVTFNSGRSQYTPSFITEISDNPEISAFFADVDTRNVDVSPTPGGNSQGTNLVYYDLDLTHDRFVVTWDDVSYYSEHNDLLNAFQLVLTDMSGVSGRPQGDFDITFIYEEINWTTGDASSGSEGLGGEIARAGYTGGTGDSDDYFELPASGDQSQMLALDDSVGNTGQVGIWSFGVTSGVVPINVAIYPDSNSVVENDQECSFTITRTGNLEGDVTVYYSLDYMETNYDDFSGPTSGEVVIPSGTGAISVDLVGIVEDLDVENDETFRMVITGVSSTGPHYILQDSAYMTIIDDDSATPPPVDSPFTPYMEDEDDQPMDLVNAIMGDTDGIVITGALFTGGAQSSTGYSASFYDGSLTELGIGSGILLTSGSSTPPTENTSSGYGQGLGLPGDGDFDSIIEPVFPAQGSNDATFLELTFTVTDPDIESISFDLLFGSEEYPEYSDNFVDIAGVIVNGQSVAYFDNGGTFPLSVLQENIDAGYFFDNQINAFPIEYDGISHPLNIFAPVQYGTNTIKIGIADTKDHALDSGLFVSNFKSSTIAINDGGAVVIDIGGSQSSESDDIIIGNSTNEYIEALGGDDIIEPGTGENIVDGGEGIDTVLYQGSQENYVLTLLDSVIYVKSSTNDDTLINVEIIGFDDGEIGIEEIDGLEISWNKLTLNGENQEIPLYFDAWIVGTGAAETLTVMPGINSLFSAGTGDLVNLSGSVADYLISMSGNQILFQSLTENSTVILSVGGECTICFDEGFAQLSMGFGAQGPQMNLGDAVIQDGETLGNPLEAVYGITGPVVVSMVSLENTTESNPFNAGSGDFIFQLNSDVDLKAWIANFDTGDTLSFSNSPTGTLSDFNVINWSFGDGEALVGVEALEIELIGLDNDLFNNGTTFASIYGQDALVVA